MKFSVDQESVSDIISALTSYSDDIDSEFRKFEEEIKKIAIKTNYNKLLYALQGIIDIYNDVICGSMRKQLIAQWIEEGESLHSFAEDVYMGEESEEAVKKIENSLEEIFNGYIGNNLIDLEFAGDANAAKTDFDDVVELFESFSREVDRIKEETSNYFERKIEDNELYRFLIPIIESIAVGVSSFSSTAKVELDRLGDNYVERMEEAKQRVEEAKKEKTSVDFDLDLFDFEDDFVNNIGTMPNTIGSVANSSAEKDKISDRASVSVSAKGNDPSKDKYESLIQALRQFDGKKCTYPELKKEYDEHLSQFRKKLEIRVKAEYDKRDKILQQYHKQLEQQLQTRHKELDGRYIKGTISLQQAKYLYAESCTKAEQLYQIRKNTLLQEFQVVKQNANKFYDNEVARCNRIANDLLKKQSICRNLSERKQGYITRLKSENAEQCVEELRKIVDDINRKCSNKCRACLLIISALELLNEVNDNDFIDDIERDQLNINLKGFKRRKDNLSWEENLRATNPGFYNSLKNADKKYTHNCQRCVMAYEVRCRGFDVIAKERQINGDKLPIMDDPNGWPSVFVDKNGNTPIPEQVSNLSIQDAISDIEGKMASYGDGARAIVRIGRFADDGSRLSGHVFVAEQINGKTVFVDPQSASCSKIPIDARSNFGNYNNQIGLCKPKKIRVCDPRCIKQERSAELTDCNNCSNVNAPKNSCVNTNVSVLPSDIRILRMDNLKITERIIDCCN